MGNSGSARRRREKETRAVPRAFQPRIIPDEFTTVEQVTRALRDNGLESCNLILGIDFTKSNEWSGSDTFGGRSLHSIADINTPNPYEDVIESIGQTLRDFDDDNCIPVFGFGDRITQNHSVFPFAEHAEQEGFPFETLRKRYREIAPYVTKAGPTSFAPVINQAVRIVNETGQYHILVIIADGQVTRPSDTPAGVVSKNEQDTIDAIALASKFPLSIVVVGVGDGPWGYMKYYDDYLTARRFDNFQFVEFHEVTLQMTTRSQRLGLFALQALMEVPEQYATIKQLGYLNKGPNGFGVAIPKTKVSPVRLSIERSDTASQNPVQDEPTHENGETRFCCVCFDDTTSTVFQCGHETCHECATKLTQCPLCREAIELRIQRYAD